MTKLKILLIGFLLIIMLPVVFGETYTVVQQNTGGTDSTTPIRSLSSNYYYGSNVTVNSTFLLGQIEYNLKQIGSVTGNVWIEIYNASASGPTINTSRIGKSNYVNASLFSTGATGSYQNFTFNTSFYIYNGTTYTIVIAGDYAVSGTNYIRSVVKPNTGTNLIWTNGLVGWTTDAATNYQNNYKLYGVNNIYATFMAYDNTSYAAIQNFASI